MKSRVSLRRHRFACRVSSLRRSLLTPSLLLLSLLLSPAATNAASVPPLGTAASFAMLGASTVTSTGFSVVGGDIGVSPGSSVTGFPPGVLTGAIYTGVGSNAGPGEADAVIAYNNLAGQTCDTDMTGVDLGGQVLTPGVYCFDTSAQLTGLLTLDFQNDSNAVFVFQMGSTLTTGSNAGVLAINGTPSCNNVSWQAGSSATVGTGTAFFGNIFALASITFTTGASNSGSLYALNGAVTLGNNAIQACGAAALPECTSNSDCLDDANVCTDEICDPLDPAADLLGCVNENNTSPCNDLLFCNGLDTCLAGVCDEHAGDPCLGGGVCGDSCNELLDNCFVLAGTECRGSGGLCDVAEQCSGSSDLCPLDVFVSPSVQCRDSAGTCDAAENCTGSSALCPLDTFVDSTMQCRSSAGVCDVAENCTGSSALCPQDSLIDSTVQCRGSGGICDIAENCSGSTASCPVDALVASTVQCRGSAGICDAAENCTGSTASCPVDALVASTVQCRGSGGICDAAENCTGSTASCPVDALVASTVECRGSGGICDLSENCTGSTVSCPADALVASTVECRSSGGICDISENCTGSTASCPADALVASSVQCRGSDGVCDAAENCTGSSPSCPANAFVASSVGCRSSAGVCDVAESCSGSTASCPADAFASSSTQCRASAGVCDVAENCDGSSAPCPGQAFQPAGTTCTSDSDVCTNDVCNASGTCLHTNNTVACDDGAFCTVSDTCQAGACVGSARNCGDGVQCTVDSCNEATNTCENPPDDRRCDDDDSCTVDRCDAELGCSHDFACRDICRPSSFYGNRGGNEPGDYNITQSILDSVGGLEVCGQQITETGNDQSPWLEGLGLDSALEGLCVRAEGVKLRPLYRELVTAALNCVMSGSDDCDSVVAPFIDVSFSQCNALCAGNAMVSSDSNSNFVERNCTRQLACYNRGGRFLGGKCALGTCDITKEPCGGGFGPCPPFSVITFPLLQVCERYSGNCRDGEFCQPVLGICPDHRPVTSQAACKEAKNNSCTIDSCD